MYSKVTLALGTALAAIALFCFVESSLAQDALTSPLAASDNDDVDGDETGSKDDKSRRRRSDKNGSVVNTANSPWTNANENRSLAVTSVAETAEAEAVVVTGGFDIYPVPYPALPPVEGTRINAGKKTSFVKPAEFPTFSGNDYREVMATTPGIVVSEEPSSPIINFGYRGLNSQRSEFMQVLKDGVSIKNVFGSYDYYRNYTEADGTIGPLGYYFYYDHRQQEGFREANSDYDLNGGSARLVWNVTNDSRFVLTLDAYDEDHGEPGGLRRREDVNPPYSVFIEDDRTASTRFFDRFRLERYYATLEYQKMFSERTQLDIKAFGGYLTRWSKRQRGGEFGTLPSGPDANTNSIQLRSDYTEGLDARVRHDYDLFNDVSTFAGGIYFYHALQDRRDERGQTPDAETGMLRNLNTAETWDGAIFAENRFHFGRLSIVPGMRLEFLQQSVDEEVNVSNPLH